MDYGAENSATPESHKGYSGADPAETFCRSGTGRRHFFAFGAREDCMHQMAFIFLLSLLNAFQFGFPGTKNRPFAAAMITVPESPGKLWTSVAQRSSGERRHPVATTIEIGRKELRSLVALVARRPFGSEFPGLGNLARCHAFGND